MTLRGNNGVAVNSSPIVLSPSQQAAKFVSELFPGMTNFEGTLELAAPRSIAAIAIGQHFSGIFSTVPVSPRPTEVFFLPTPVLRQRLCRRLIKPRARSTLPSTPLPAMRLLTRSLRPRIVVSRFAFLLTVAKRMAQVQTLLGWRQQVFN